MQIFIKTLTGKIITLDVWPEYTIEKIRELIFEKEGIPVNYPFKLMFKGFKLESNKMLKDYNVKKESTFYLCINLRGGGKLPESKEINIKFIKEPNNTNKSYVSIFNPFQIEEEELYGLIKLCFLKEISSKLKDEEINKLPELLSNIIQILKFKDNGFNRKYEIINILEKMNGNNIINFSKYVDKSVNSEQINILLKLLGNEDLEEMEDLKKRLFNYNEYIKAFEKDFEEKKKNSIYEFSVISLVIIEREDFQKFEKERKNCPNRVDKILYHGTGIEPISCILTGYYKKSIDKCYQFGKGTCFTDKIDYCWFYGGQGNNRINVNKIPEIDETFTFIANSIYYDKNGFRKVNDEKYTPKKNEINFAYAKEDTSTILNEPDEHEFYGTEYVIWDLDQICPILAIKMKRREYCVIWRDNNFSSNPVYNNEFDKIFKKFLKERLIYIEHFAEYNIYPCDTTEKALELVERKKYNKIILISNIGNDLGGKKFIDKARKIIGNDVIILFLAYNIEHLKWITKYKNALFSNDPNFYEEYLECFSYKYSDFDIKNKILLLKEKIENHYKIQLNFYDNFLDFPQFTDSGRYGQLIINKDINNKPPKKNK